MRFGAQRLSLRGRALQALAQREQSRVELRRKLLRHAANDDEAEAVDAAAVDHLLDALEAEGLLSSERFVESRVHARLARFGNQRIRAELAQHGLAMPAEVAAGLAASESQRAADARARRYGAPPDSAEARAAQARFLVRRGFSPEVVHRLMRSLRS